MDIPWKARDVSLWVTVEASPRQGVYARGASPSHRWLEEGTLSEGTVKLKVQGTPMTPGDEVPIQEELVPGHGELSLTLEILGRENTLSCGGGRRRLAPAQGL